MLPGFALDNGIDIIMYYFTLHPFSNFEFSSVFPQTSSANDWWKITAGFADRWNLPHCLGDIDRTHFHLKAPPNSGSLFYNYKNFYSIVVITAVNHNYEFTQVDVGSEGCCSVGRIWNKGQFYRLMQHLSTPWVSQILPQSQAIKVTCHISLGG